MNIFVYSKKWKEIERKVVFMKAQVIQTFSFIPPTSYGVEPLFSRAVGLVCSNLRKRILSTTFEATLFLHFNKDY